MIQLKSADFFSSRHCPVAIEPRLPQPDFPEHYHDFNEIVLIEQGRGVHVLNGIPHILSKGCVCFVRHHDRHLYESTNHLHLTNILYRESNAFRFVSSLRELLPREVDGFYPANYRLNSSTMTQVKMVIAQLRTSTLHHTIEDRAQQELFFMQILLLLRKGCYEEQEGSLNGVLKWMEKHSHEELNWAELAERFSMSLRTLHRNMKQQTGLTPFNYLNRLRLLNARNQLRHSDTPITDIAYRCGFSDSNYFSTLFKREFGYTPSSVRK